MLMMGLTAAGEDSLRVEKPKKDGWLKRLIDSFSNQDTLYVEPQHYNWALMLQSITTYDYYRLSTTGPNGQSISFSPQLDVRMGPYFGWRWVFLGYTIDLHNINIFKNVPRFEIDASIYSARFGADIFYRRTVNDYKIRSISMGSGIDTSPMEGLLFDGLKVSITGVNLYYIFNYRHFSYPAAFAQSSCQKISCGTWMAGLGYLNNSIEFDYNKLEALAKKHLGRCLPATGYYVAACHWRWPTRSRLRPMRLRNPRASASITSILTASDASGWCGTIPAGMPVRRPSSVPTTTISHDLLPTISLATSIFMSD